MRLGPVGELAAHFAFKARDHEPRERVAGAAAQKVGMRMAGRHKQFVGRLVHGVEVDFDFDAEKFRFFAAIDRQHAMRRHAFERLAEFEIVSKALRRFFIALAARAGEPARAIDDLAEPAPQVGPLAEPLGKNMSHAQERVGRGGHAAVGIHEIGGSRVEILAFRRHDFVGQRLEATFPGRGREGLLFGLERQVQVFELLGAVGVFDLGGQLGSEFALRLDRAKDGLLALGEQFEPREPRLDFANLLFVETAGLVLAVAGNKRHGVAVVE